MERGHAPAGGGVELTKGNIMRVILFEPRFAELVKSGKKHQTIRKSARCRAGDVLSLRRWSGLPYRSKQVILKQVTCSKVVGVTVDWRGVTFEGSNIRIADEEVLAHADGFQSFIEMADWFAKTHSLPFSGEIIYW